MSESFHHVLFPGSCRVLGRVLPPLSLWTFSVLQAVRSPFLAHDADQAFTLADLQIAVRCACAPILQPPRLRPSFRDRLVWRFKNRDRAFLDREATAFLAWLAAHQRLPQLWTQETDSPPRLISAPLALSSVAALMQLGMTHVEAWSCSPGYARWLILANDERSSDAVRFADDEEIDDTLLEEFEHRSEAEIIAQARLDLDDATFDLWLQQRSTRSPKS